MWWQKPKECFYAHKNWPYYNICMAKHMHIQRLVVCMVRYTQHMTSTYVCMASRFLAYPVQNATPLLPEPRCIIVEA